ncbi:hypothetical protein C8R44DRAFT_751895 [Mycena epipterygia]|nr:hypothetical protein C8R44DRAFT_751895 [Mycena epipterygia]
MLVAITRPLLFLFFFPPSPPLRRYHKHTQQPQEPRNPTSRDLFGPHWRSRAGLAAPFLLSDSESPSIRKPAVYVQDYFHFQDIGLLLQWISSPIELKFVSFLCC